MKTRKKVLISLYDLSILLVFWILFTGGIDKPTNIESVSLFGIHSFIVMILFIVDSTRSLILRINIKPDYDVLIFLTYYFALRYLLVAAGMFIVPS